MRFLTSAASLLVLAGICVGAQASAVTDSESPKSRAEAPGWPRSPPRTCVRCSPSGLAVRHWVVDPRRAGKPSFGQLIGLPRRRSLG
jgi:hypothetical protein